MSVVFSHQRLAVALFDSAGIRMTLRLSEGSDTAPAAALEAAFHYHQTRLDRLLTAQANSEDTLRVCPEMFSMATDGAVEFVGSPRRLNHARAVQEAYSDILGEAAVAPGLYQAPHPGFASSISLHVAVISAEGQLLVPRRSEYWSKNPGLWGVSFSIDLLPEDFESGTLDEATLRLFA